MKLETKEQTKFLRALKKHLNLKLHEAIKNLSEATFRYLSCKNRNCLEEVYKAYQPLVSTQVASDRYLFNFIEINEEGLAIECYELMEKIEAMAWPIYETTTCATKKHFPQWPLDLILIFLEKETPEELKEKLSFKGKFDGNIVKLNYYDLIMMLNSEVNK